MPDSSPGDDEDKERACNNGSLKEWKMKKRRVLRAEVSINKVHNTQRILERIGRWKGC